MPRPQPKIPTAQDAMRHFKDMAYGRLSKRSSCKRRLFGGWGGNEPTMMKTELVTPTAQALKQAKADLQAKGELPLKPQRKRKLQRKPIRKKQPAGKKKKAPIKGRVVKRSVHSKR